MKINYYYSGQFRRVLKHLIRVFGEFQVKTGLDVDGNPKYKVVPCRYADISKMTAYALTQGSENIMPSAPMITINVQTMKFDRPNLRSPASETIVMGTNKSPSENEYIPELDKQYKVTRYNPTPWKLAFNVNIWTTTLTNKMELFEQIVTLFNPSVQLQLSDNPLDWTGTVDIELVDCQFSTRAFPQGTDEELDVMVLTFEVPMWLSLPANVQQANLIKQIVTNINTTTDDLDIDLENYTDIITNVYTPKNMCVLVDRLESTNSIETYEVTLVSHSLSELSNNGNKYSWDVYMKYLEPSYDEKSVYLKFQHGIEDKSPIIADVIKMPTSDNPNKLIVQVDTSSYQVKYAIKKFVSSNEEIYGALPEDMFINISEYNLSYKGSTVRPNELFRITNDSLVVVDFTGDSGYVYNSEDSHFYQYSEVVGWHQSVMNKYRQGYWKIAFRDN